MKNLLIILALGLFVTSCAEEWEAAETAFEECYEDGNRTKGAMVRCEWNVRAQFGQ